MAMVNLLNGKDSRWLQLEVCREFQRQKCSRPDTECKFAHPPANVEVQNGRVTACYDSIKGRCNREKPPCKYFHPPQHLKDQLLINGRNHLALKNALMQQMGLTPGQPLVPGQVQAVVDPFDSFPFNYFSPQLAMTLDGQYAPMAANPYLTGMPQVGSTYSHYFAPPMMQTIMPDPTGVGSPLGVVPQTVVTTQQKMPRSDRLEVCREYQRGACKRAESECRFAHPADSVTSNDDGTVTVCMDAVKGRCNRDPCRYFHPPLHLQAQIKAAQSRAASAAAAVAASAPVNVAASACAAAATVSPALLAQPQTAGGAAAATAAAQQLALALEIGKKRPRDASAAADTDLLLMDMKSVGSFYYDNFAFPAGMVPYKRPAADKSGMPVYQPNATTYQQLMQLQQPFVPVSCEYPTSPAPTPNSAAASPSIPETAPRSQTPSSSSATSQCSSVLLTQAPLPTPQQQAYPAPPLPQPQQQQPQPPPPQQLLVKEGEQLQQQQLPSFSASSIITSTAPSMTSLPAQGLTMFHHDPAALAKEVAQQNYAKAIKMAAAQQQALSHQQAMSQLNPLNYTGVALNKQALSLPPPTLRFPAGALQYSMAGAAGGLNFAAHPYASALAAQQNFFNLTARPPPVSAATFPFNPYAMMRPGAAATYGGVATTASPIYGGGLLAAQYPTAQVSTAQMTSVVTPTAAAAAAAQNNNNNVVMQPFKKLKTS